jgi:hypothetical protein
MPPVPIAALIEVYRVLPLGDRPLLPGHVLPLAEQIELVPLPTAIHLFGSVLLWLLRHGHFAG